MRLTIKILKQFLLSLILFSKHYCEYTSGYMWVTWIRALVYQIKVVVIDLPKDGIALILNGSKVMFAKLVLTRLRSGLPTHLCSPSFKGQGAFSTQ